MTHLDAVRLTSIYTVRDGFCFSLMKNLRVSCLSTVSRKLHCWCGKYFPCPSSKLGVNVRSSDGKSIVSDSSDVRANNPRHTSFKTYLSQICLHSNLSIVTIKNSFTLVLGRKLPSAVVENVERNLMQLDLCCRLSIGTRGFVFPGKKLLFYCCYEA